MAMKGYTLRLICTLEDAGYKWRPYSGRAMYGKQCVSVTLDDVNELFELGRNCAEMIAITNPTIDNMGRGIVAYWPGAELEKTET